MADQVYRTIQHSTGSIGSGSNLRVKTNKKSFKNFSYFLGGIDVTHQNLNNFTPYIRGVSRIFLHKTPRFMALAFPEETERFKAYLESGYTTIDGIGDITVEFVEFEGGFAAQRFANPSLARDETENITISLYELSGSPVREYLDTWITGVRDTRSGIAHYHGVPKDKCPYEEANHTVEFIYVTLDPTGLDPEYVCMFAKGFPTKVPKSHLNYEKGNRDNVQMDLDFRITKYESPKINDVGIWYIEHSKITYSYLDFDPHIVEASGDAPEGGDAFGAGIPLRASAVNQYNGTSGVTP